jgi:hypothetical protein
MAESTAPSFECSDKLELFKFYEEAAEKAKAHAWAQTTWILAINAGIIGFSVTFFADKCGEPGFFVIECLAAGVGVVLCAFLLDVVTELGGHISHYWTSSNTIAASYPPLTQFISADDAKHAASLGYRAGFPRFCRRLQVLACLFLLAHVAWLTFVLHMTRCGSTQTNP